MGNGLVMGRPLAAVEVPADIIYLQNLRGLTRVARLRPKRLTATTGGSWCWYESDSKPGYSHNHQEGGNFVFMDGHAKFRRFTSLKGSNFGLVSNEGAPPTAAPGHTGVCGQSYPLQF